MVRAPAIHQFLVSIKVVAVRAVPAGIDGLIDVSSFLRAAKQFLRGPKMLLVCCAHPGIVGYIELRPCQAESLIHTLDPRANINMVSLGCFHHMLAILVKPHAEKCVVSLQAMIAGKDISCHLLQRMPDMRRSVRIINGG